MRTSIIILNWNRKKDTIECLKSLEKISLPKGFDTEIIVVDNASTDNSQNEIKKYLHHTKNITGWNCELLENKKNLGFASGNNVGIKHAINHSTDYILILNNDTIVKENFLKEMLICIQKDKRIGSVTPKIYFAQGYEFHKNRYKKDDLSKVIWSAGGVMDWNNIYGLNRGVDEVDTGQYDKSDISDFATGACVLLNAKAIKSIGDFDENYFLYMEDVDLSYRMKKNGWKIMFCPKAIIWHKVAQSSGIGSDLNDYFIARNRLIFGMSHASLRTKLALYKESVKILVYGRPWQKKGVFDFYFMRLGKGSWK